MSRLLEVSNLSRRFGGLMAVNNLSFSVDKGDIVGLDWLTIAMMFLK